MSDAMEERKCEAELAAAIYSLENVRDVCHEWLDGMLDELADKGKLACSAQVIIEPEGSKSQIGISLSLSFLPIAGGMPVMEAMVPEKVGVVH